MDKDLKLGYEYIGDMLFFGELHDDSDKLKDIWFTHDLKDYNDQYKTKCIRRCEYLIAMNNTRATDCREVDVEALKRELIKLEVIQMFTPLITK